MKPLTALGKLSLRAKSTLLIEGLVRDRFSFATFLNVLLAVMPGSVIGGQLGALLNRELPINTVRGIYAVAVVLMAGRILMLS